MLVFNGDSSPFLSLGKGRWASPCFNYRIAWSVLADESCVVPLQSLLMAEQTAGFNPKLNHKI